MNKMLFCSPCHFGLESVLKRELEDLGIAIARVEDGKVYYHGDETVIPRANINLRTAERVLLIVAEFTAVTFDELFEKTKALPWKTYIPADGKFWVTKANSVKSKLYSPSDIQSIVKKAMVDSLKPSYNTTILPETGAEYPLRISILKDRVQIGLDTTGVSLHKRGYRTDTVKAPIEETLAAALLMLTPWKKDRIFVDPFCGSGTFPIEAAMIACHMAPGLNREFTAEKWLNLIPKKAWYDASSEALDAVDDSVETDIQGYDIDPSAIRAAKENADRAGVLEKIHFQVRDVKELSHRKPYGFIVTNPPYGERISEKEELPALYGTLGERFRKLQDWSLFVITPYEDTETQIGRKADKNRKIYNGMMKTYFYSFLGAKPPKHPVEHEKRPF